MINKAEILNFVEDAPKRLDIFLVENFPQHSRSLLQNLIKKGNVLVNGAVKKPSWPLAQNDEIKIVWPTISSKNKLSDLIIYEDKNFFVINKPAGLLVHPQSPAWEEDKTVLFATEETLVSIIYTYPPKNFDKKLPRLGLIHRLDKETSGVMLIAKNQKFLDAMIDLFSKREVHKTYNAICCGVDMEDEGEINVPIGRETGGRIKASALGRNAITVFKVLERAKKFTLMALYPKTGRTNQLRVHMNWLGYPVLGDWLYKGEKAARLMLHARKIEFKNPLTKKKEKFEVPPPLDFKKTWAQLKDII